MNGILPSLRKVRSKALGTARIESLHSDSMMVSGKLLAALNRNLSTIDTLQDAEFRVFSQWGEDGILDWLISRLPGIPESFVEFGVENYTESNTRFLLKNRNWRGLVLDGSEEHIAFITADNISWRHDITAKPLFIDAANIDDAITSSGFTGEIGLLSVDIDGNDYWVWEAIASVSPWLVVVEYNTLFGDLQPLSVPYDPGFVRGNAHNSHLYWGASVKAFEHLGLAKGYVALGSNGAGSNMFFVRKDLAGAFVDAVRDRHCVPSRFREGRDAAGNLTLLSGPDRKEAIADCTVVDVATGQSGPLREKGTLFSEAWYRHMAGAGHGRAAPPVTAKSIGD